MRTSETALLASYEVLLELATGGMATVHLARRLGAAGFDRLVVIKRIHRHLLADADSRAMFVDEARLSSNVHHPNVVPIVDVVDTDGELALVMDYVESVSLAALLAAARARGELLPADIVSRVLGDALQGLHAAHEATDPDGLSLSIVHRDVSPQNIIVGLDGVTRLIDFGIAKATERLTITKDDALKGKLRYMSPEQGRREPLDRRSDVFASALVLYEALAGRPAITGNDDASIWISLMVGDVEPLTDVSPELASVLDDALQAKPDMRVPTALELKQRLSSAVPPASAEAVVACVRAHLGDQVEARREAIRAARRSTLSRATKREAHESGEPASTHALPAHRHGLPRVVVLAAFVVTLALAGIVLLLLRHPSRVEQADAAPLAFTTTATASSPSLSVPGSTSAFSSLDPVAPPPVLRADASTSGKRVAPKPPPVKAARGRKLHDNPYANGANGG